MSETNSTVEYRDIPGFPGYRVGSDGTVWSCRKMGKGNTDKVGTNWRLMKPGTLPKGYRLVQLRKDSKYHHCYIHRLVLLAFIGPCPEGMEGCHEDGNRDNNQLSNLRWDTHKNNQADRLRHGTDNRGEKHNLVKLTNTQVLQIRKSRKQFITYQEIADKYGVSRRLIGKIIKRQLWTHI